VISALSYPCVVVGIDGSRSANQAAIRAVDEAVDRNIPLQLLSAIGSVSNDPDDAAVEVAAAERAVRNAFATTTGPSSIRPSSTTSDREPSWSRSSMSGSKRSPPNTPSCWSVMCGQTTISPPDLYPMHPRCI
jgi:hypothetical protein